MSLVGPRPANVYDLPPKRPVRLPRAGAGMDGPCYRSRKWRKSAKPC